MHGAKPRDGEAVEILGHYDPTDPRPVFPEPDRALHWLLTGAQPTDTVRSLLRKAGIWAKYAEVRGKKPKAADSAAESAEVA